jgi:hypothetical protein
MHEEKSQCLIGSLEAEGIAQMKRRPMGSS